MFGYMCLCLCVLYQMRDVCLLSITHVCVVCMKEFTHTHSAVLVLLLLLLLLLLVVDAIVVVFRQYLSHSRRRRFYLGNLYTHIYICMCVGCLIRHVLDAWHSIRYASNSTVCVRTCLYCVQMCE